MTRRLSWTEADMRKAVERALKALKGTSAELTNIEVARCAARYTKASCAALERYLSTRTAEQRVELGYPDPKAEQVLTGTKFAPDIGSGRRMRAPDFRSIRR